MAFRRFGGITYSSTNNFVHSEYANNSIMNITTKTGQPNSKELFRSHIDLSGNSILNVACIYFEDGTVLCSAPPILPTTNTINENTINGNTINENTINENTINENTINENTNSSEIMYKTNLSDNDEIKYNDKITQLVNDTLPQLVNNTLPQLVNDNLNQLMSLVNDNLEQLVINNLPQLVTHNLKQIKNDISYSGKGEITDNISTYIYIPFSKEYQVVDFTMQITPIYNRELGKVVVCNVLEISSNVFEVFGENCSFYWNATGTKVEE